MKNPFYKANLLLRISTFLEHLASVDVDHTEVCGNARAGPVPLRHAVLVGMLARGLPFGGHVQIGMMEHTTIEDLAAICLKRFEARGGEILVPTSVKLAKCHYRQVLLDQFLVTRVDTEVVIADYGEERPASHSLSSRGQR